ncbi:SDR family NAD(P)-dependent oxidoreductase [Chelatococcus asaccharovorans]|uniref:NADP-dependent 3-hydroxy acid dehydrogenase YdfG n=1 Tax=Chelatococcus asaccharovorans TaxID=28210 RepID=A0A2V3U3F3_9HYPH|nr:SDR family NAD(P)-dependent oxidoreductase [Chelatococcus asaccharovorans]MBS7702785.1 SDR family NAD(P)-dependent oxidoreductase [Chelatococcus asaccharovorans]PXW57077.1 NADP-dependent 3-hydroxy acid dehydrogenase YdfG [Chelatococcus asaccharovorans]CAH1672815.1 NADP-dependent 3-hydroxy acid dehydrogenase YdfG [Chelatococcus asaccharovorans]CAH1675787.1 NADP-dependent 3-hydroxy acid dehydrogenase YdfG [Chelatococcus asaccharovorans]
MLAVDNRIVMVSGASRGIGRAVVELLLASGFRVSAGMRDPSRLAETDRLMTHAYEAEDPDNPRTWVAATVARWGGVDALVNSAGINPKVRVSDPEEDALDQMWRINVKGPLRLVRAALPHLEVCGHGRVVNLGSLAGKRVGSNVGYAMTKFAVVALTHGIRREGRAAGIRATVICPGYVATDMTLADDEIPRHDMSSPEDLAQLVQTALLLPNNAAVSELLVHCQFEPTL